MVNCHIPVKLQISTDLLGQYGFIKDYRALKNTQQFSNAELVVKTRQDKLRQVSLKKLRLSIKLLSHSFRVVPP